jgi:adenylate cyclase
MSPETIDEAEASGTAELLAIDAVVLPGKAKLTIDDLAEKVGVEADVVKLLWRALGFVDTDDDERSFTKHDVAILKSLVALTEDGLVDPVMALQVARVIGMSLANVATAVVDAGAARSVERREAAANADDGEAVADDPSALAVRAGELLPFMSEVIDYSPARVARLVARR